MSCFVALCVAAFFASASSYSNRLKKENVRDMSALCHDMKPGHRNVIGSTAPLPFVVVLPSNKIIEPGAEIKIQIKSTECGVDLMGFFIQARKAGQDLDDPDANSYGEFLDSDKIRVGDCFDGTRNIANHADRINSSSLELSWKAPSEIENLCKIQFRVTFVQNYSTVWIAQKSEGILEIASEECHDAGGGATSAMIAGMSSLALIFLTLLVVEA